MLWILTVFTQYLASLGREALPPEHRSIVVVDVAGFTSPERTLAHQLDVQEVLYEVLGRAFDEAGISWEACYREDRGDGAMILVPATVPKILLADQLPDRMVAGLRRANATRSAAASIRLRIALHFGEVQINKNGVVSQALNVAFRIVDAPVVKSALNASSAVAAFVASDDFYHQVITQDAATAPDLYRRIAVEVKTFSGQAWLRLRGRSALSSAQAEERIGTVLPGMPRTQLTGLHELLSHVTVRKLATIVRLSAGPSAVLPNSTNAWDVFVELCEAEAGPDGLPPALVFLALLAEEVDGHLKADLTELVTGAARKLSVERKLRDRVAMATEIIVEPPAIDAMPEPDSELPAVWRNVPSRGRNFIGRGDLLDLLSKRVTVGGVTTVPSTVVHGMAGIGKTRLVVEYIHRHQSDYDLVWWLDAAHPAQIRAGLTELARVLDLPGSQEANTAIPAVLEALRTGKPYRRWLLVFDSADSPEEVKAFFPTSGHGEILITSRNPNWADTARPVELDVFDRSESIALLRRPGSDIDAENAELLAGKLGDLPLAVEQAAAWLATTGMPVAEYLRLLDEKVMEVLDTQAATDYNRPVATAWNVSFDELKTRNAAAYQLLRVCALLAPEPISRELFTGVRGVRILPELDGILRDSMRLGRAIQDINRYGLAKIDRQNNTLLIHRLVQAVVRHAMSPHQQSSFRHGAHELLADRDPGEPSRPDRWPLYEKVLPHSYSARIVECDDPRVRVLVTNLAQVLYYRGDHERAVALLAEAHKTWSEQIGDSNPDSLRAAGFLGLALRTVGRFREAAELNQRTLTTVQQGWGDSEETVAAELRVAADVAARGEFSAARADNERIYLKTKELYGEDDPLTLQAAHNLAATMRLCGGYQAALSLDKSTYRHREAVLGPGDLVTLKTLSGLVADYLGLADYQTAHTMSALLARRLEGTLGEDSAETLRCNGYLAMVMRRVGAREDALALSEKVLTLARRRYGPDHPHTLMGMINLAGTLAELNDVHRATACGDDALAECRRVLGADHPTTLAFSRNLVHMGRGAWVDLGVDPVPI